MGVNRYRRSTIRASPNRRFEVFELLIQLFSTAKNINQLLIFSLDLVVTSILNGDVCQNIRNVK